MNKRAGDIVQGDKTGDKPLSEIVKDYIKKKYKKPGEVYIGVVHRLDRPTSGIVVFARTSKALSRLNKMFANQEVSKIYWAIVEQQPENKEGKLIHWLKKNPKNNKSYAYLEEVKVSKKSILYYTYLKALKHYHLLEIKLETGRHHQIRSQLSKIGCTIKGDLKYGAKRSNKNASIHLHSRHIEFIHPVKKVSIQITAPTPPDITWDACN